MKISKDTQEVIDFLDYYTSNHLRKRNDLAVILEIGATYNCIDLVNDIIFYGTSLWKVYSVLKKNTPDKEGYQKLENEFHDTSQKLLASINLITENFDEQTKSRFYRIYLKNTQGTLRNLIDLSFDLAQLKELQTQLKSMKNK